MTNKFTVSNMLTERGTGRVTKIYAMTPDRQPFDLLDVSVLKHYGVATVEGLREKMTAANIAFDLVEKGHSISLTLASQEDATRFIEQIAPLYNDVLQG
ncbi:hypothetical protein [Kurthia massiliensis]|uniref:hypothetical protein n=1 Tax=Kurthia massiliensis TaxID=1033739 RepID=UPI000287BAE5|nr:hypothetical protein [Kurthia massiliensis]